jgi:uncharacterized protein
LIVADTGAVVALIDAGDRHHEVLRAHFETDPRAWILPWAILPEVDYLLLKHLGRKAAQLFLQDVADGGFTIEWPSGHDLTRAVELNAHYAGLELGLVDCVVLATAERLRVKEIATLDIRDFGAVQIAGRPRLIPRDL